MSTGGSAHIFVPVLTSIPQSISLAKLCSPNLTKSTLQIDNIIAIRMIYLLKCIRNISCKLRIYHHQIHDYNLLYFIYIVNFAAMGCSQYVFGTD